MLVRTELAKMNVDLKIKNQFFTKKSFILAIGKELQILHCQITIVDEKIVFKLKSEIISNINFIVPSQFAFMLGLKNVLDRENHSFTLYDINECEGSLSCQFDCLKTKILKVCVDFVENSFLCYHMLQLLYVIHLGK